MAREEQDTIGEGERSFQRGRPSRTCCMHPQARLPEPMLGGRTRHVAYPLLQQIMAVRGYLEKVFAAKER